MPNCQLVVVGPTEHYFTIQSFAQSLSKSNIATKLFRRSEPLYFWLYRYLASRVHLIALVIYIYTLDNSSMLACSGNNDFDAEFNNLVCLHNGTFVYRTEEAIPRMREAFQGQQATAHETAEYQWYFPHFFMILMLQYLFNLASNIVFYLIKMQRQSWFTVGHEDGHRANHLLALCRMVNQMLSSFWQQAYLVCVYLLLDLVPIAAITGTMLMQNRFFNGRYLTYGFKAMQYYILHRDIPEPLTEVFPLSAKCTVSYPGSTLVNQHYDLMCILRFNHVHQYIALFFWFFYVTLLLCFTCGVLSSIAFCAVARVRLFWHIAEDDDSKNIIREHIGPCVVWFNVREFTGASMADSVGNWLVKRLGGYPKGENWIKELVEGKQNSEASDSD